MRWISKLSTWVGTYLTWIVFIVVGAAYWRPEAFYWGNTYMIELLSLVMFGMGMTLKAADFAVIWKRPREVLAGCVAHYTVMPFLAYLLTLAVSLPPDLAAGMILLGACPSGTASNIMSYLAKGDVPLAISITTASTLLAPILTPLLMWGLAGQWVEVSFMGMLLSIVRMILLPIALGVMVHKLIGEKGVEKAGKCMVLVSAFAVLSIVGAIVAVNGAAILKLGALMIALVLTHNLGGFLLGYLVTGKLGMEMAQRRSVTLETGMQNSALACSLASVHFAPAAAIPGAIASAVHQITGSLLASWFAKQGKECEEPALYPKENALQEN